MDAELRSRGENIISLQASVVTEAGLRELARLVELDVDELVASRDFPEILRPPGTRGKFVTRKALLSWWRSLR